MTIHPEALKAARNRAGFSQEELAQQCTMLSKPISKKAIYHYEKGKTQPSAKKAQWLAEALKTTVEALSKDEKEAEAELREWGYVPIKVLLDTDTRLNFGLVTRHYNVSIQDLIHAVPWMFTLLAEMSLADRRRRLDGANVAFEAAMALLPDHLAHGLAAQTDFDEAHGHESDSIAARDIFGKTILETSEFIDPFNPDVTNPFAEFLRATARAINSDEIKVDDLEGPWGGGLPNWPVFQTWLHKLTGGDVWARYAIEHRHARVDDLPTDLLGDDRAAERAAWLAEQVPQDVREREERRRAEIKL